MMSGYVGGADVTPRRASRSYEVVARDGGWSISLNGACTRPLPERGAAERIALHLQAQADALNHRGKATRGCGGRTSLEGL